MLWFAVMSPQLFCLCFASKFDKFNLCYWCFFDGRIDSNFFVFMKILLLLINLCFFFFFYYNRKQLPIRFVGCIIYFTLQTQVKIFVAENKTIAMAFSSDFINLKSRKVVCSSVELEWNPAITYLAFLWVMLSSVMAYLCQSWQTGMANWSWQTGIFQRSKFD